MYILLKLVNVLCQCGHSVLFLLFFFYFLAIDKLYNMKLAIPLVTI